MASPWRVRLAALLAAAGQHRAAQALGRVLGRYSAAGGALLANGLAYSALFAIVPAIVVAIGILGALLGDAADRGAFIETVSGAIPPLRDLLGPVLAELDRLAGSITVLGILGFAWGASRFTAALEESIVLVFGGRSRRPALRRQLLALASVGLLVATVVAVAILAGIASFVEGALISPARTLVDPLLGVAVSLSGPLVGVIGIAAVYRFVPPSHPTWGDALAPAIAVGVVLALATRLFVLLAPRLIGEAAVFGALATAFIALAWFSITFQALLVGAAWVGDRQDRRSAGSSGQPSA